MTACSLCSGLVSKREEIWNEPLLESPNFVVLPSVGALVEGWVLLVPKAHVICMGALSESLGIEMQQVKHTVYRMLQEAYGNVSSFEHGPTTAKRRVGCGVDHAHLHLVPVEFSLRAAVNPFLPEGVAWSTAGLKECRNAFARGEDYLYFEQTNSAGQIATHKDLGSQLFRRAIAKQIGRPSEFDWREYPQLPNVKLTIDKVRSLTAKFTSCQTRLEIAA